MTLEPTTCDQFGEPAGTSRAQSHTICDQGIAWGHGRGAVSPKIWRGKSEIGVVRTDREKDEGEHAEQRNGVIVPPQVLRVPRKTPVGGDE